MASKKEFVLAVTEQLKENARASLAGHGINSTVLQEIIARPDVMSKLATVLYSMKAATKGAPGLKKSPVFKIGGYKSFAEFNMKARLDVEEFVGGLPAGDQATFQNANNILTIILLPEEKKTGEETTEEEIVTGKSVAVTFDTAVRNEYRQPGGLYLAIYWGDSAIRPAEEKIAVRTEKANKKKQSRRTPAQIKNEIKRKAAKKLEILKAKRADLQDAAFNTSMELEQLGSIAGEFGVTDLSRKNSLQRGIAKNDKTAEFVAEAKAAAATLTKEQKKILADAANYAKSGNTEVAKSLMKTLGNPVLTKYVLGGSPEVLSADSVVKNRKRAINAEIKSLVAKNEQLLLDLSLAKTSAPEKVNSIKSTMSRNNTKIKELRAKLGTYKNISTEGFAKKASMLAQVNTEIEENIKMGMSISAALTDALAGLNAKDAEKEIIKQEVLDEVASGMPMQYAVQQALQANVTVDEEEFVAPTLGGSSAIADILSRI